MTHLVVKTGNSRDKNRQKQRPQEENLAGSSDLVFAPTLQYRIQSSVQSSADTWQDRCETITVDNNSNQIHYILFICQVLRESSSSFCGGLCGWHGCTYERLKTSCHSTSAPAA